MTSTSAFTDNDNENANINVPSITLSGQTGLNCLMFSPIQLVSLGLGNSMHGSADGTGISCRTTDRTNGHQSEMPVFAGHTAGASSDSRKNTISKCGLVKLIKTTTDELNSFSCPQIDSLAVDCQGYDNYTAKVFDNMRMAVATSGSPSRYYNRCYLSGRDYSNADADKLTGRVFSGAFTIYGERYYLVSLQYSQELEYIFPVADAYFNLVHKLIPLGLAAPRVISSHAAGSEYLKCRVRRSNGQVQPGFIKLDQFSMIIYKPYRDGTNSLLPYITVYFKSNGDEIESLFDCGNAATNSADISRADQVCPSLSRADVLLNSDSTPLNSNPYLSVVPDNLRQDSSCAGTKKERSYESRFPVYDCFKAIKVSDFLAENPGLTEFFETELGFEQLTIRMLLDLIKDEQH